MKGKMTIPVPFGVPLHVYLGDARTHWGSRVVPSGARIAIPISVGRKWLTLLIPTSVEVVKVPITERVKWGEPVHHADVIISKAVPLERGKWKEFLDAMKVTFGNIAAANEARLKEGRTVIKWPKKIYREGIRLLEEQCAKKG